MKTIIIFFLFMSFLTIHVIAQSSDEGEIRRLEKHWTKLLDEGDTTALLKIWSKEYVVNNPNGRIVTPKDIVSLMKSGHVFPAVKRIIEKITFNQNIAIVMGEELQQPANMIPDENEWISRRFTNVWIKTDKDWQLASRQSSVVIKDGH